MKKQERDFIETELSAATGHLKRVWKKTEDYTPGDAIIAGILTTMLSLFRILDRVKTED